jgi:hypothetical protein
MLAAMPLCGNAALMHVGGNAAVNGGGNAAINAGGNAAAAMPHALRHRNKQKSLRA